VKIYFSYFKLSNSKFARDLQNTQTQNPNTQKIENPNSDLNLLVLLGAYVCQKLKYFFYFKLSYSKVARYFQNTQT
jgi:hypothetical protein